VVAAEVRNLAQRSAAAAKEIKTLIGASVERVTKGSALVDQAGQTMDEIVISVKRVAGIMADIATASGQQSAGINAISETVSLMDAMTRQNSGLVEEAAAAAASLRHQVINLNGSLGIFKTSEQPVAAPVARSAAGGFVARTRRTA